MPDELNESQPYIIWKKTYSYQGHVYFVHFLYNLFVFYIPLIIYQHVIFLVNLW